MVRAMPSSLPLVVKEKIELNEVEEKIFEQLRGVVGHYKMETQLRVAGGWVRDKLLGRECSDIDIALDKMMGREFCEKMKDYLGREDDSYCVIQSNPDQSKHLETARMRIMGMWIDFVNLRSEKYASDSRIPEADFGTATEDAYRRDLTINSLFYNISTNAVEDLTGRGIHDLKWGRIATPLPPKATFLDDPLRVLRAIRFGARFDFVLDEKLKEAAAAEDVRTALKDKISRERIGHEVDLMMLDDNHPVKAISWIHELGLFGVVFTLPENMELKATEFTEQKCVTCMNSAWKALQQLEHSMFSSEERRLYLYGALFFPMREFVYLDKKSKSLPVTTYIIRNSLKLKVSDADILTNLHETMERFVPFIKYIESEDVEFYTDVDDALLCVSPSARRRVMLGLTLRKIKGYWRVSLLMSVVLLQKTDVEDFSIASELFKKVERAVAELNLDKVWELKPLLDGNAIMGALQVKGQQIGEWKERIIKWQLSHPTGSSEDCFDWMQQMNAKRVKLQ